MSFHPVSTNASSIVPPWHDPSGSNPGPSWSFLTLFDPCLPGPQHGSLPRGAPQELSLGIGEQHSCSVCKGGKASSGEVADSLTPAVSPCAPAASPPHTASAARPVAGSDWPGGSRQVWPGWCRAQSRCPGGAARNHWHPRGEAGAWSVAPSLSWGQESQGGIHRPEGRNTVQGFSAGTGGSLRVPGAWISQLARAAVGDAGSSCQ